MNICDFDILNHILVCWKEGEKRGSDRASPSFRPEIHI